MNARLIALLAAASLFASTLAAAEKVDKHDRFQLWAACSPMKLIVDGWDAGARGFGLTTEAVEIAVRSRLRAAQLYDPTALLFLGVNVNVRNEPGRQSFSVTVQYHKPRKDIMSGVIEGAVAWGTSGTGFGESSFVLSAVSQYTDKFIDEYLRVNAESCRKRL